VSIGLRALSPKTGTRAASTLPGSTALRGSQRGVASRERRVAVENCAGGGRDADEALGSRGPHTMDWSPVGAVWTAPPPLFLLGSAQKVTDFEGRMGDVEGDWPIRDQCGPRPFPRLGMPKGNAEHAVTLRQLPGRIGGRGGGGGHGRTLLRGSVGRHVEYPCWGWRQRLQPARNLNNRINCFVLHRVHE